VAGKLGSRGSSKLRGLHIEAQVEQETSINSIPTIHKEKEMADFRKWLYASVAVAILAGMSVPASTRAFMQCEPNQM
jgi:hypothetical protein